MFLYLAKNRQISLFHFFSLKIGEIIPFYCNFHHRSSASLSRWEPEVLCTATEATVCGRRSKCNFQGLEVRIPFRGGLYEDLWYIDYHEWETRNGFCFMHPWTNCLYTFCPQKIKYRQKNQLTENLCRQHFVISFLAENPEKTLLSNVIASADAVARNWIRRNWKSHNGEQSPTKMKT